MFRFLTIDKQNYIKDYIRNKILPNLAHSEFNQIIEFLYYLIEYISIRFSIEEEEYNNFLYQLQQNNHRDLIGIFNLLFPYIDDRNGTYELHHKIYYISDISIAKDNSIKDESKNSYLISNMQFNLYSDKEVELSVEHIKMNFYLLLETIDRISNKLFINWLNIRPITIDNYKNTLLYKNSIKLIGGGTNEFRLFGNKIKLLKYLYVPYDKLETGGENDLINDYIYHDKFQINYDKLLRHNGISIGDIYNTLYYDLFLDIVNIKWLIYQDCFENRNYDEIYIKKLNEHIIINELYFNIRWDELEIEKQNKFILRWNNFCNIVLNFINSNNNRSGYYFLLLSIIVFMERNYNKMNYIIKKYNYQKISNEINFEVVDADDINENDDIFNISNIDLVDRIKIIPVEFIYDYILESINLFIPTWYGRNIIEKRDITDYTLKFNYETYFTENNQYIDRENFLNEEKSIEKKMGLEFIRQNINLPENLTVKYKFIYNFAKSYVLQYIENKAYVRPNWYNRSLNDRINFINMLNYTYLDIKKKTLDSKKNSYLNAMSFTKYYSRTYKNNIFNNKEFGNYLGNYMFQFIKDKLIDIVFECHIYKGLLSEFVIDRYLTDKDHLGSTYDIRKKNLFKNIKSRVFTNDNISRYNNKGYYFLTDSIYGELNEIHINNKKNYFELLYSELNWYSFYSMDWVSQINFFHRYINNRVLLITGATGQGKSTQIPKLLLYGLKMIDRNNNGKVICSQPRIKPTVDNSERISFEMGVPILETSINNNNEKIFTFNSNIQYKTENNFHIVENHKGLLLKTVTDAILANELFKSPIFKDIERSLNDNEGSNGIEFNVYRKENKYDIIIVDESHEHNLNMDVILTIARDTIKLNNSLKLVIVSATMLDDEPLYRRYYKEIDDNFMYPPNNLNINDDFDRTYTDRRIHISPPGETTQFTVSEIYLDKETETYQEAEDLGINKVIELCSSIDKPGDILFFSLGKEDIHRICKKINSELSYTSKYICLPLYREIPIKWQDAYKNVKKITVNRIDLFDEIFPGKNIPKKVSEETYTNFILIATNIAEASITIDSLKIVIDTGYFINVSYDYIFNNYIVDKNKISESSRLQRKGRVGRVSSGTVYYMYKKDSRKYIKNTYDICKSNIYNILYKLSPNKTDENPIIPTLDWLEQIDKKINDDDVINQIKEKYEGFFKTKIFKNLITTQYSYYGYINYSIINLLSKKTNSELTLTSIKTFLDNIQINISIDNIYNKISDRSIRKLSGYDIKECIYDIYGKFYIIHPDEDIIKRNILTGDIINNNSDNHYYISKKIYYLLEKCFYYNLFINNNIQNNNIIAINNNDLYRWNFIKFDYEKSIYGRILNNLITERISDNDIINRSFYTTFIYAYICDVHNIVIIMIILLNVFNYKLSAMNKNYNFFKTLYKEDDLYIFYSIAKEIYNKYSELRKYDNYDKMIIFNEIEKKLFLDEKKVIFNNLRNKKNYWKLNIDIKIYKKYIKLFNQNKINSKNNIYDYINESPIDDKLIDNFFNILKSLSLEVDYNISKRILQDYIKIKNSFDRMINFYEVENRTNDLLWFKYNMSIDKSYDEYTNVKRAFIYGFGMNQTVIYDNGSFYDINNYKLSYKISKDSLTDISEMMIYLNRLKDEIYILINSNIDELTRCNLYNYNPFQIVNISLDYSNNVFVKLLNKFNSIHLNKNKYLSFLKTEYNMHTSFENLFTYANNFTEFLIKLFNTETNFNLYNQVNKQSGGVNNIKFKINKLPNFLNKYNISIFEFNYILYTLNKNYKIYIDDNYIKIKI